MQSGVKISGLKVKSFSIPTETTESDGTLQWQKTDLVWVELTADESTGVGYTYADLSTALFIDKHFREIIEGKDPLDNTQLWYDMYRKVRNLGSPGISSLAISAIDIALWDLKAKLLNQPLIKLLGQVRDQIPAYASGGFTSYSTAEFKKQFQKWLDEGFFMFKMKVGRNPGDDVGRVNFARSIIGEKNRLFVDANGAFTSRQAVEYAHYFNDYNVTWFEEPVSSDDPAGLRFVRDHAPPAMNITAGEYGYDIWYFQRMLSHHSVDVMQLDASRCGGITGFLKSAVVCEAYHIPVSAHTVPTVHSCTCCATKGAVHLEYFFDHARIEEMLFEGYQKPKEGYMVPETKETGLGIKLKDKESERFLNS